MQLIRICNKVRKGTGAAWSSQRHWHSREDGFV
jgi:uncharacterized cupin superfamily protein